MLNSETQTILSLEHHQWRGEGAKNRTQMGGWGGGGGAWGGEINLPLLGALQLKYRYFNTTQGIRAGSQRWLDRENSYIVYITE